MRGTHRTIQGDERWATGYNLYVRYQLILLLSAGLFLLACSQGVQSEAAVRQGVIDYLSTRPDLNISQMQVEVSSVAFRQNEADATVSFRPKGGGPSSGMQMSYTLERRGNRWVVKGKGSGMHAKQMPGMPPVPQAGASGGTPLPPGHPSPGSATPPETKR